MNTEEQHTEVLTREELENLLQSLEEWQRVSDQSARMLQGVRGDRPKSGRVTADKRQSLDQFASQFGQRLSSRYQKLISLELLDAEEILLPDLAEILRPDDEVVLFSNGDATPGCVFPNRALFFEWLSLSLGARADTNAALPQRPLTSIERRFLTKFAADCLDELRGCNPRLVAEDAELVEIEEAARLVNVGKGKVILANFELRGLANLSRLRIALPAEPAQLPTEGASTGPTAAAGELIDDILDSRVTVRAQLATVSISLSELAALRTDQLIPLPPAGTERIALLVEGTHKFDAIRGSVGNRTAVQITERRIAPETR